MDSLDIDQLAIAARLKVRTVRYILSKGLIQPTSKRSHAFLFDEHELEKLKKIKDLRLRGLTYRRIQEKLRLDVRQPWFRIEVTPGLEVHVSQELYNKRNINAEKLVELFASFYLGDKDSGS